MEGSDLDEAFADWAAALTPVQRSALRRWQAANDGYAQIQRQLRVPDLPDDERPDRLIEALVSATLAGRIPQDMTVWRGVRSCVDGFGRLGAQLAALVGGRRAQRGFLSVSTDEALVRAEFLTPPGAGGSALLVLDLKAGERAAWLPSGGWSGQAHERELLLPPGRRILITAVTFEGGLPILRGEVS